MINVCSADMFEEPYEAYSLDWRRRTASTLYPEDLENPEKWYLGGLLRGEMHCRDSEASENEVTDRDELESPTSLGSSTSPTKDKRPRQWPIDHPDVLKQRMVEWEKAEHYTPPVGYISVRQVKPEEPDQSSHSSLKRLLRRGSRSKR